MQGDAGTITIPPDVEVSIANDGTISGIPRFGTPNTANVIGRIKLVNPPEHALERGDDGLFRLHGGMPAEATPQASLVSGFLEGSNVNMASEMVAMISLSRQFELQMKVLKTADENDQAATKILSLT